VAADIGADVETPTLVELARPRNARHAAAGADKAAVPRPASRELEVPAPSAAEWPAAGAAAFAVNKADLPGPATPPLATVPKTWPAPSLNPPFRGGVAAIRRSRRNLWIMLVLATLALLAAGALLLRGSDSGPRAPTAKGMIPGAAAARPQLQR
jgi:hypothetical protein